MTAKSEKRDIRHYLEQWLREGWLILLVTLAAYLGLALATYSAADPGWSSTGEHNVIQNSTGRVGAWVADILMYFFGQVAFLLPLLLAGRALSMLWRPAAGTARPANPPLLVLRAVGYGVLVTSCCTLLGLYSVAGLGADSGGVLGQELAGLMRQTFNLTGSTLLIVALLLTSLSLATGLSWLKLMDWVGDWTVTLGQKLAQRAGKAYGDFKDARTSSDSSLLALPRLSGSDQDTDPGRESALKRLWGQLYRRLVPSAELVEAAESNSSVALKSKPSVSAARTRDRTAPVAERVNEPEPAPASPSVKAGKDLKIEPFKKVQDRVGKGRKGLQKALFDRDGSLPALELLDAAEERSGLGYSRETLEHLSRQLETRLAEFNVEVEVVEVNPGPVITRFEIQPAPGVKVSKISGLAKDLARSLAVISVRVVEVIPGKSVIGIEIPNEDREIVRLRQVLASGSFAKSDHALSLGLGYDIAGNSVIANLGKMPHLLVAGTTGSGKSVGVNAMIISMLYKATPDELRLIMIDPKMLELSVYEGIPHLLTPVVTDMKDADNALRWCVGEMERRYKLMSMMGVRNIAGFNGKVRDAEKAGKPILDPTWQREQETALEDTPHPELTALPYIVVIVDEFADMMMIVGKKVEEKIARLAQKARAAGIHMILATQRPSVDVITGLIKSNIPTRMAFQVSSKIDSRTILDQGGAEQLLGHGDMLYLPSGSGLPIRVHGAFVGDDEVHRVVEDWKQRGEPDYLEEIVDGGEADFIPGLDPASAQDTGGEQDALYDEAVAFVLESRKASISAVQRKLRIGYNRAATLVEAMEAAGVVSSAGHNGSREVLAPGP